MATLILVRHGKSTWNADNKFSGWVDVPLSRIGREEARKASEKIRHYRIDVCFTSFLIRAIETAVICLTEFEQVCGGKSPVLKHEADDLNWDGWEYYEGDPVAELPIFLSVDLDERYSGNLPGLNKAETIERYGRDLVQAWRRSFSVRPQGGESLENTAARTLPYFRSRILTHLKQGENVLVATHGNSLRSMIMELDQLSPEAVPHLELATSTPLIYEIDAEGNVMNKTILISV